MNVQITLVEIDEGRVLIEVQRDDHDPERVWVRDGDVLHEAAQ